MTGPAVSVSQVSKRFRLGESAGSLRDFLVATARRLAGRDRQPRRTFLAVDDVSFAVAAGEAVGIIGPNGAGKSTVLKLLSRILRPDRGTIHVGGRLAGLIEVGAGFHGDLTGRENIFLNGAILGMRRQEIRRKFDDIVAFAGLEAFLDTPVKRYSSGMYARLGFSVASHVDADVLLVDEVLSVGDAVFRLRCLDRMRNLVRRGTALVFVTHDLEQMLSICSRTLVMARGRIAFDGPPNEAVGQYLDAVSRSHADRATDLAATESAGDVEVLDVQFLDSSEKPLRWIRPRTPLTVLVRFRPTRPIAKLVVEANLRSAFGQTVLSLNSGRDGACIAGATGAQSVRIHISDLPLAGGEYFWNVRMWDADTGACLLDTPFRFPCVVNENGNACGMVSVVRRWSANGEHPATELRNADLPRTAPVGLPACDGGAGSPKPERPPAADPAPEAASR